MNSNSPFTAQTQLFLTIGMVTCLVLLINVSFKIIVINSVTFSVNSLLCPLVAGIYLFSIRFFSDKQQWLLLNQSLITLYLFSTGIYLLVNLPAADKFHEQIAYQIVFEDIPKKFFSSTLAFGLSFYVPRLYFYFKKKPANQSAQQQLIFALCGGLSFFIIDFWLLFANMQAESLVTIFFNSLVITLGCLGIVAIFFGGYLSVQNKITTVFIKPTASTFYGQPVYQYLVSFSVIIALISLACEYRLVSFSKGWVIAASSIVFPLALIASNLISELYGYKANIRFILILVVAQCMFDVLLMAAVALPSPETFNLNPYYTFIMPRRIPAAALALLIAFCTNAFLLDSLKHTVYGRHSGLRILIANTVANSLLCLVNYSILFVGIYPYEQIFTLSLNSWVYKFVITLLGIPLILSIKKGLQNNCLV